MNTVFIIKPDNGDTALTNKPKAIYFQMSLTGRTFRVGINVSAIPKEWDLRRRRFKNSAKASFAKNRLLDAIEEAGQAAFYACMRNGEREYTAIKEAVRAAVLNVAKPHRNRDAKADFWTGFDTWLTEVRPLKADRTLQKYRTLRDLLRDFETNYKVLTYAGIDSAFYSAFVDFLVKKGHNNNTISKYVSVLKTFLTWATEAGYKTNKAFEKFSTKSEAGKVLFLTKNELAAIEDLDLTQNQRLGRVRDVFLFAVYTGQRHGDIVATTWAAIKGTVWELTTEKTKDFIRVPLNGKAQAILAKYKGMPFPLPTISEQKQNDYLKELCQHAGIDTPETKTTQRGTKTQSITLPKYQFISMHTARRTFCTLALESGLSPAQVMAITGHKSLRTLQKYLGSDFNTLTDKLNTVF